MPALRPSRPRLRARVCQGAALVGFLFFARGAHAAEDQVEERAITTDEINSWLEGDATAPQGRGGRIDDRYVRAYRPDAPRLAHGAVVPRAARLRAVQVFDVLRGSGSGDRKHVLHESSAAAAHVRALRFWRRDPRHVQ